MPIFMLPEARDANAEPQSDEEFELAARWYSATIAAAAGGDIVASENAMTIWSDASPIAQLDERLPRWLGSAAESAMGMKTSTWLPLAICLARANDPAECVGAT